MTRLVNRRPFFGPKAPIVEALIDLSATATVDIAELRALALELADEFPHSVDQIHWGVQVQFNPVEASASAATPPTLRGYLLHSHDRTRAVQIRRDGVTVSHLAPYGTWDALRDDAERLWPKFVAAARPTELPRLAVRYINQLVLPGDHPMSHWLRLGPSVPEELGLEPVEYTMRTVLVHPEEQALALVNMQREYSAQGSARTVVLDINCVFQEASLDPASAEIWSRLDMLREFKNDVFFGAITSHTEELYA